VGPVPDTQNLLRAARAELQRVRLATRTAPLTLHAVDGQGHSDFVGDIKAALADGSIAPWFQPIVDAHTGAVTAFEALVRWVHPARGNIPPAEFLAHAEIAGFGQRLTHLVMERSIRFVRDMMSHDPDHVPAVHINVWPSDLRRPRFVDALRQQLAIHGVPGDRVVLEITESDIILLDDMLHTSLRRISAMGVHLAIDDFGTGYSSLSHLVELPVDHLKIDRSFIAGITTSPKQDPLVCAVISIATGLDLSVVAEGVETAEQVARLREMGCGQLQGYFVSAALPQHEALTFTTDLARFREVDSLASVKPALVGAASEPV
ncbi:MAG: EAL domain-containing protein, partial [Ilumatobacteraceae bacterium]